jgi:coenzyme Q-binding protein COQ10
MPKFNMTRKYPYTADQLFSVAADVESYNQFLPLVRGSRVWARRKQEDGTETFKSALTITYRKLNIRETIKSDMKVNPASRSIHATSADGALQSLDSVWMVRDLPEGGAEVEMNVDYTMKSKVMQTLVSSVFDLALRRIANALGERTAKLYGLRETA